MPPDPEPEPTPEPATIKVATYNAPERYGLANLAEDCQRWADKGAKVIALQEVGDTDPDRLAPDGWQHYRPTNARSAAIMWDPDVFERLGDGAWQLHSTGWDPPRFVVWVKLRHLASGRIRKIGSFHLLADKDGSNARAKEFKHQASKLAGWIEQNAGIAGGDANANPGSDWMAPVRGVARHHAPTEPGTGPDGQPIDQWWSPKPDPAPGRVGAFNGASDHDCLIATVAW